MPYTVRRVTGPAADPVTLTEAKAWLRLDGTADDALVTNLIGAATELVERFVRRALIEQTLELVVDDFPSDGNPSAPGWWRPTSWRDRNEASALALPFAAPLVSVDSVTYLDPDGVSTVLAPSAYRVDTLSEPAVVVPVNEWPSTLDSSGAVRVEYTCGFGTTGSAVPVLLRQAVLTVLQRMYDRECPADCMDGEPAALARPFRVVVP